VLYFGRLWASNIEKVAAEGTGEMHTSSDSNEEKDS